MCGISGIMMYPMNRTEEQLAYIRELAGELAIEIQARGTDATGIAIFNNKKNNHTVLKHNVPAEELTSYDTWIDTLDKHVNANTTNILIHTRAATKGSESNNDNNHPIVTATTVGIHNGMIWNDDDIFEDEGLFRQAQVDSEVIFRLADKIPTMAHPKHIKDEIAEKISGVFAVAMVKKDDPFTVHYFRDSNPTTFAYIPTLNVIVFASLKNYISSAIHSANLNSTYMFKYAIETDDIQYLEPMKCVIMQFDVSQNNALEQLFQEQTKFVENYGGYYTGYGYNNRLGWDDDWGSYYDMKEKTTQEDETIYDFINEIESKLSADEMLKMIDLLDKNELDVWNKAYRQGRESTENDIKVREEKSHREGFEAGKAYMKAKDLYEEAN